MEYFEHTSKVLHNLVLVNLSTLALKLDFLPFLHILLHMIDFMSHYKFILYIIKVPHALI